MLKQVAKGIVKYIGLLIIFVALLSLAFTIPNRSVVGNVQTSNEVFQVEGHYPFISAKDEGAELDNFTDWLMISKAIKGDKGIVPSAMYVGNYARYWHGYLVFLRPMLAFISYTAIRQVYAVVLMCLLALNLVLLSKQFGTLSAMVFALALSFQRFNVVFNNMQYANVMIIMLVANLVVLKANTLDMPRLKILWLFLLIGSITNYIDLLTYPLITFGVPCTILLAKWYQSKSAPKLSDGGLTLLSSGLGWLLGYGMTWFSKWIIGSWVLHKNVVNDAIHSILFRTEGSAQYPTNRVGTILKNIQFEFPKINILMLAMCIVLFAFAMIYFTSKRRNVSVPWVFLVLGGILLMAPYVWYVVLTSHSQIHTWFTYREQLISVFAFLMMLVITIKENAAESVAQENIHL